MTDQQNELLLAVGRLEGKMDSMQGDFRESKAAAARRDKELSDRDDALEERLRQVENRWAWALGICATISFASPYIPQLFHK